jgi:GTP-binding protein
MITERVPAPVVDESGPFQMQISALDYDSYVGVIGIGRITRGELKPGQAVTVAAAAGGQRRARVLEVKGYLGLARVDTDRAAAGDIVCITGIEGLGISDTLCDPACVEPLPALAVDEPTVSMTFQVNDSPFAGLDGKYITSRNLGERLDQELIHNVALRVEPGDSPDRFRVSGRGELHLAVLIETMRREGYELGVSRPEVIQKEVDGEILEPFEIVVADVEETHQGALMEEMGRRKGELLDMVLDGRGRVRLEYRVPSRGMIGFRNEFLTLTSGSGILTSIFDRYDRVKPGVAAVRQNGVLVSMTAGKTLAYALYNLQERGRLFLGHGEEVYEGQLVGIHSRGNDLPVNPTKGKQLTNIRAAGSDEALILTPPIRFTLEQALEFIAEDELVEVTPHHIRLRKKLLREQDRKRSKATP